MVAATIIASVATTPLRDAVRAGDVDKVKELLAAGTDANELYENDFTPIYAAEKPEIIELLVAHGARLNDPKTAHGELPIEAAADKYANSHSEADQDKWKNVVQSLQRHGAEYTIHAAVCLNDVKFIETKLSENDAWVREFERRTESPLRTAARYGRVDICKLLLEHKADPDEFELGSGWPIIFHAVDHPDVVKLLIAHGANLRRRITWHGGRTGMWIVSEQATALHHAASSGNVESVKLLLDAGLDPNATDSEGNTVLHIAIKAERFVPGVGQKKLDEKFIPVIDILLSYDACLDIRNNEFRTPALLAKELRTPGRIRRMIQKKTREEGERYRAVLYPDLK